MHHMCRNLWMSRKPEESGALAIPWCRFAKTDRRTTSEKIGTGVSATAREACGPSRDRCTGSTPGTQRFLPADEHVQNSKTQISGTFIRLSYRGVYRGVATRRPQIVDHRSASGMRLHAICAICHCSEGHSNSMILGMVSSVEYPLEMCIMKRDFVKVVRTV